MLVLLQILFDLFEFGSEFLTPQSFTEKLAVLDAAVWISLSIDFFRWQSKRY